MTPYYSDDHVTVWHADMREIEITADVCITDPPYGQTNLTWDRWVTDWPSLVAAALPPVTSLWCFGSMRMFFDHLDEFTNWTYAQEIVWEKHNGSAFHADRFKRVHEFATHWYRGSWAGIYKAPQYTADATRRALRRKARPTHTGKIEGSAYASEDGGPRLMRSVQQVRSMHGRAMHPTEKPLGIIEPLIKYSCPPDGIVLDPFAGSGSVLAAAKINGRKAVGVEADERYCEIIATRLAQGAFDFGEAS